MNLMQNTHQKLNGFAILVVEDNDLSQQVAQEILEYAGATVMIAEHGKVALNVLNKQAFDCVLMDLQMPIMDGFEATQLIRADARWIDLPIIAVTANADQQYRDLCQQAGMNDFLAKPINPDILVNTVLKWL